MPAKVHEEIQKPFLDLVCNNIVNGGKKTADVCVETGANFKE